MSKPRILILRGGAIGDFVLTLPALQAVRERWPDAYIEIVGYPWIAELARAGGLVDRVVSLDKAEIARYFSMRPDIPEEQAVHIRSFSFIISYLHDPAGTVRRNMLSAGARQVISGSPIVEACHAAEHLMKPLEELAVYPAGVVMPRLVLAQEHLRRGAEQIAGFGRNVVAIHPGSGSPSKNWPLDRFLELGRRLSDRGDTMPVLIIGPAEAEIGRRLRDMGIGIPALCGCSVVELAGALSACAGYFGNDSGVTHLAASVGIRVVALYGPTEPGLWGARGERVRILAAAERTTHGLAALSVDEVLDAFHR